MNIITRFQCPVCLTEYERAENAMCCEQSHVPCVDQRLPYIAMQAYPLQVALKMADGTVQIYKKVY